MTDDPVEKMRLIHAFLDEDGGDPLAQLHDELDQAERTVRAAKQRKVRDAIKHADPSKAGARGPLSIFAAREKK